MSRLRAALFAGVLGASASYWLFASVPETWIFAALSLAALALVATRRGEPEWRFQLAAVYAIGVLTTNVVPVGIFAILRHVQRDFSAPFRTLLRAAASGAGALLLVIALAFVQQAVYPTTTLFFLRDTIGNGAGSTGTTCSSTPARPRRSSCAISRSTRSSRRARTRWCTTTSRWRASSRGAAHYRSRLPVLLLWAAVLAVAARGALRPGYWTPPVLAAFAILAYNFAFHSFFGNDRFLYSCDWVLFTIGVAALGFDRALAPGGRAAALATALPALFLAAELLSNWRFLGEAAAASMRP